MNQRGFATLEVILMVMVIGILASIAVPRFTDVTTKANTAKIQADLSAIDTALAVYHMEKGDDQNPATVKALADDGYLQAEPNPPTGSAFVKDSTTALSLSNSSYGFDTTNTRAVLKADSKEYKAEDFTTKKSN